jgi:hypothetical protein
MIRIFHVHRRQGRAWQVAKQKALMQSHRVTNASARDPGTGELELLSTKRNAEFERRE